MLLRTMKLFTISFCSSALLVCYLFASFEKIELSYFSINPKMLPLVLLMKWRASSKDLMPEKSNLRVIWAIYFMIFDILRVLSSSICRWLLLFWSKSFIKDLRSRTFTFNFYKALAKCRTLLIFFNSIILSAINSYFSLHFCICFKFYLSSSWFTDS